MMLFGNFQIIDIYIIYHIYLTLTCTLHFVIEN